jgi:hypothetical protein
MSDHLSTLSLGGFIVLTIIPVVLLAAWLIIIYDADRHPEWRHGPQDQPAPPGLGPADVPPGRVIPGPDRPAGPGTS